MKKKLILLLLVSSLSFTNVYVKLTGNYTKNDGNILMKTNPVISSSIAKQLKYLGLKDVRFGGLGIEVGTDVKLSNKFILNIAGEASGAYAKNHSIKNDGDLEIKQSIVKGNLALITSPQYIHRFGVGLNNAFRIGLGIDANLNIHYYLDAKEKEKGKEFENIKNSSRVYTATAMKIFAISGVDINRYRFDIKGGINIIDPKIASKQTNKFKEKFLDDDQKEKEIVLKQSDPLSIGSVSENGKPITEGDETYYPVKFGPKIEYFISLGLGYNF